MANPPILLTPKDGSRYDLAPLFADAATHVPDIVKAIVWTDGLGPWFGELAELLQPRVSFHLRSGRVETCRPSDLARGPYEDWWKTLAFQAMAKMLDMVHKDRAKDGGMALVLRRNALISLFDHPKDPAAFSSNIYTPSPIATAHERIADPEQLERDFPGLFAFEPMARCA